MIKNKSKTDPNLPTFPPSYLPTYTPSHLYAFPIRGSPSTSDVRCSKFSAFDVHAVPFFLAGKVAYEGVLNAVKGTVREKDDDRALFTDFLPQRFQ